jgi:hypothetical protein
MEREVTALEERWRRVGAVILGFGILSLALIPGYSGFFGSIDTDCGSPLRDAAWGTPQCVDGLRVRVGIMAAITLLAVATTALGLRSRRA